MWLSMATARVLSAKMERTGRLRPLDHMHLEALGASISIDIQKAGELPIPALRRLGRWLNTDVLLIGRVGRAHERDRARELVGSGTVSKERPEGAEMWVAARLYGYPDGVSLGSAFVEGTEDGLFELYDGLTQQILERLSVPETHSIRAYGRPTHSVEAFRLISQANESFASNATDEKARQGSVQAFQRALRIDPAYGDAHRLKGHILQAQGDTDGARSAFGQAAALDPADPQSRWSLARLARAVGDPSAEAAALAAVLEAQPEDDRAIARLAQLHVEAGRYSEARRDYDRALSLSNREPERLAEVATFLLELGEPAGAEGLYRQAIQIEPGNPDHHLGMIVARTHQGHLPEAEQALEDAVTIGSESADLWLVAGQLSKAKQDYGTAAERLEHALRLAPDRPDLLLEVADLHSVAGNLEGAVQAYENALIKGVPLEDIAEPLTRAYGQLDEGAADSFVKSLALDSNRIDILLLAARLFSERGHHQAAVIAYEDALIKGAPIADIAGPIARAYLNLDDATAVERILGSVPDRPDLALIRGDLYERTGRLREAMGSYERAVAASPTDVELMRHLGSVYQRLGDRQSAAEVYASALQHAPADIGLLIALGNVLRELDRHGEARPRYRSAIDAGAKRVDAFIGLGLSAEALNRVKESRLAYRNALLLDPGNAVALAGLQRIRPPVRRPVPSPEALIAEARGALTQGDHETAIDRFRRALMRDKGNASAWNDLGLAYAGIGEIAEAREAFESAERLVPTPETIYNLGRLEAESGRYDDASMAYRSALERDSSFAAASLNLSSLQIQAGHAPSAVVTLKKAMSASPERGDIQVALANAYLYMQEFESARNAYERAALDPHQLSAAYVGLGNVALAQSDTMGALDNYRQAIHENEYSADPHINIGSVLAVQGQADSAIEAYRVALQKAPRDLTIYLNLATLYYQSEQYEAALEHLGALLKQNSGMPDAQRLLGHIALATGDPDLAIEAYHIALSIAPSDLDALRGLALAFEEDERVDAARDAWLRWLEEADDRAGLESEIERIHTRLEALPDNS
jgi:tetratricopeptide (TPR) repeat protein